VRLVAALVAAAVLVAASANAEPALRVGSKRFTESYILAEIVALAARDEGITAVHEQGLGGSAITYRALLDGAIDVYPEYTGTIAEALLVRASMDAQEMAAALRDQGLALSSPLGFENTYALAASKKAADRWHLARISDLREKRELRFGLSPEFVGRTDGWPGVAARYGLLDVVPTAIDHALAYDALASDRIDVTDVYTTDAKIARYGLVILTDDRHFFPSYEAVLLFRSDVPARFPAFSRVLTRLRGSIDAGAMQKLNARAELDGAPFAQIAAEHLGAARTTTPARRSFWAELGATIVRHGPRHIELVVASVLMAALIGIPLGVLAHERRRLGTFVLAVSGVVQTIPSLALFCFFIPLLGIGPVPALAALFLYGLLPIVQSTYAGLASIPAELHDAALALGLTTWERLRHVELPLAARNVLAGVKTSAVVAVGSATIAAFIGAGGLGEPISTGLSLNDVPTILQGALPAAALALLVQAALGLLERAAVPAGLRGGDQTARR
jgi:osmoprotectant transport system permease protein